MTRYARLLNGVVDCITYDPDREKITDFEEVALVDENGQPTGETVQVEVGWHWGGILPEWLPVPDDVFGGYIQNPDGTFSEPAPVAAVPNLNDYEAAIQGYVDDTARSKLFRDGVTLASYTASTNPQWAAEAEAFVAWRDQVWAYAYQELARVQGGDREQPSVTQILSELPLINWS